MELDAKTVAALTPLLDDANGKRKKHRLTLDDVGRVVQDALASSHGIAVRHGGAEPLGWTTICLGVAPPNEPGTVVVGLGWCSSDRPSPGRRWKDLQPWMQDFDKNLAKARAWAGTKARDRVVVTVGGRAGRKGASKGGADGAKLLAKVLEHPDDDAVRLVYADHLLGAGDPRGELISVQIALGKTPKKQVAQRRALLAREKQLLRKHGKLWTQEATQFVERAEIERGFVHRIETKAQAFASHGAALLAREPVQELRLFDPNGAGLEALAKAPHLARLRSLELFDSYWLKNPKDVVSLNTLFRSKFLGAVRKISLQLGFSSYGGRRLPDASALFDKVAWPGVEELTLGWLTGELGPQADNIAASLARAKLPALKRLVIGKVSPAQRAALSRAFPRAELGR